MTFRLALSGAQQAKLLLVAALAVGVLSTVAGRGTVAYFTTQVKSDTNTFTAGTLHLQIGDVNGAPAVGPVSTSITFDNMKPGDTVYAPIELDNTGTLGLNYGVKYATTTSGSQDLAPALKLAILASGGGTGTRAAAPDANACSAATWATPAGIWDDSVRASAFMVAGAGQTIVTAASLPGTPGRQIDAGDNETLCLQITWPSAGADDTYNNMVNGATNTTVVFTFDGLVTADAQTNDAGVTTAGI